MTPGPWRLAYRGIAPKRYLERLDPAARADEWREYLLTPPESLRFWLIERGGFPDRVLRHAPGAGQ